VNQRKRNVLIAIDDGPPSSWALSAGSKLAREIGAAVVLLHVVVPPEVGASEIAFAVIDDLVRQARADGRALLDAAKRRVPPTLPLSVVMREGFPATEIMSQARDSNADYIVMGTRGGGRWAHFILGSVANAVIREAPCPVLAVSRDPDVGVVLGAGLSATAVASAAASATEDSGRTAVQ
jgi:nucleotide-binding universal stress UspA family protein